MMTKIDLSYIFLFYHQHGLHYWQIQSYMIMLLHWQHSQNASCCQLIHSAYARLPTMLNNPPSSNLAQSICYQGCTQLSLKYRVVGTVLLIIAISSDQMGMTWGCLTSITTCCFHMTSWMNIPVHSPPLKHLLWPEFHCTKVIYNPSLGTSFCSWRYISQSMVCLHSVTVFWRWHDMSSMWAKPWRRHLGWCDTRIQQATFAGVSTSANYC